MTITQLPGTDHPLLTRDQIETFLYREARYADEGEYDAWEALWSDDAIYWVPAGGPDSDPNTTVSVIFDNRSRISTRLNQLRTGKRYAQAPASQLRRIISNVEVIREDPVTAEIEVAANFLLFESKARGSELWGGRTTYRLRIVDGEIRLASKKVVLVGLDKPLPTLGFLI